jgi:hypothetical protein
MRRRLHLSPAPAAGAVEPIEVRRTSTSHVARTGNCIAAFSMARLVGGFYRAKPDLQAIL